MCVCVCVCVCVLREQTESVKTNTQTESVKTNTFKCPLKSLYILYIFKQHLIFLHTKGAR